LTGGINDPAFQAPGWEKRTYTYQSGQANNPYGDKKAPPDTTGNTVVHWMRNTITGQIAQIKIKLNNLQK